MFLLNQTQSIADFVRESKLGLFWTAKKQREKTQSIADFVRESKLGLFWTTEVTKRKGTKHRGLCPREQARMKETKYAGIWK